MKNNLIEIENLHHAYKDRQVLRGVDCSVKSGEIFGLLGPNGSGKTTLMRIVSTAMLPDSGKAVIAGLDVRREAPAIRRKIGVVFQSPSLDGKLKVRENLLHHGHLYGLSGQNLKKRIDEMLAELGMSERANDIVEKLSGGLKRRAEIAKTLLHKPELLILDEPSTGLDPAGRNDLWQYLEKLRDQHGVAVLVTTHLMEEAERCDRVGIMDQGKIVSIGEPAELKRAIGADVISVHAARKENLAVKIQEKFRLNVKDLDGVLQIEHEKGPELLARLAEAFPGEIDALTYRKPTLEDVFLHQTGHTFWNGKSGSAE